MKPILGLFLVLSLIGVAGCASSTTETTELRLGMSKKEVINALGQPDAVRGAIRNKHDQTIEVWQYELSKPNKETVGSVTGKTALTVITLGIGAASFRGQPVDYWMYFLDDQLVQWGQAGDWENEKRSIYEVRFNPAPRL